MTDNINLLTVVKNSPITLYILCGYPYSGKSYFAQEIVSQKETELVSIDSIFILRGFSWDDNNLPKSLGWVNIFIEAYQKVDSVLKTGKSIIFDSTNHTLESRDKLREIAKANNAECKVIFVKTPAETIWKRWEENNLNPTRSKVSRELVQQTIYTFEEPTVTENVIIVEN